MRATFTGLDAFGAFVRAVQDKATDARPLMRRVAEVGRSQTVKRVEAGEFEPNAPATAAAKGSSKPLVDTGRYLQSINVAYDGRTAAWGSNDVRARLLHDGGTVRPKRAKFLAFPPDRAARRHVRRYGSPRAAVSGLRAEGYRVWTRVRPDGTGGAVLAQRSKRSRTFVLLVLKKSVTVPPRPHYFLTPADGAEIARMATDWLAGALT